MQPHLADRVAVEALGVEIEEARFDVDGRDDELLNAEHCNLDLLVDVVHRDPGIIGGGVSPVHKNNDRDVQDEGVGEDHSQDHTEPKRVPEDQMEPRVEDERLACNHRHPADGHKRNVETEGVRVEHILEEEAEVVWDDAVGGGQETPEVKAPSALKRGEDDDVKLDNVVG